jgi:alpha-glucosidase
LNQGEPYYLVYYEGELILYWSLLGFTSSNLDLTGNLTLINVKTRTSKNSDQGSSKPEGFGEQGFNEIDLTFSSKLEPDIKFTLVFRSYNEGVAFRYLFPEKNELFHSGELVEQTEFNVQLGPEYCDGLLKYDTIKQENQFQSIALPIDFIYDERYKVAIYESGNEPIDETELTRKHATDCILQIKNVIKPSKFRVEGYKIPWRIIRFATLDSINLVDTQK